ncbi:MAG: type II 3-dehydroquinate dehydratase [Acidobacteriota bacterium]|nr:type II 3-dehydroquinate dehydratase [Acidobacteriota bacterium]
MAKKILVINGPNLNLLGERELEIYGKMTLKEIEERIKDFAHNKDLEVEWFQSNHEGEIVEKIQQVRGCFDGIIINPAALSYTSYSILDALKAVNLPSIEVHVSNIFSRQDFRKNSVTASACLGIISGFGWKGYLYALMDLIS